MTFDPDRLLAALPMRTIQILPATTKFPSRRSFGDMSEYNGFSGRQRLRTHGVSKWLRSIGAMHHEGLCEVCQKATDQLHAEDYFNLASWMNMCRGCHVALHKRFASPKPWLRKLDEHGVLTEKWPRLLSTEPFDLAKLLRQRGHSEPSYETFIAQA